MRLINRLKTIKSLTNNLNERKILIIYRIITLIGTNFFYLLGYQNHSIINKILVVSCITIASIILTYLYRINEVSQAKTKIIVLAETIGNCFILIPSGGINSPYVWYSLNTVVIASLKLSRKICWLNLFIYLIGSTGISYYMSINENISMVELIFKESNIILSFLCITMAIRLLAILLKKLKNERISLKIVNDQLYKANKINEESIDHIMNLYHTVHTLSSQTNINYVIKLLIQYTQKITKSKLIFFLDVNSEEIIFNKNIESMDSSELKNKVMNLRKQLYNVNKPKQLLIIENNFMIIDIKSSNKFYGVLGIKMEDEKANLDYQNYNQQLKFLSELGLIVMEKVYLERMNEKIIKASEQKRIASELHDSALQRLFSMSCGINNVIYKLDEVTTPDIKKELYVLLNVANQTMKELRISIYDKHNSQNSFYKDLMNYLNEVEVLNNIIIKHDLKGNDEYLDLKVRRVIYRIINECISNAVRHSNATKIEIILEINSKENQLMIIDNGCGYDIEKVNKTKTGLGLSNINHLVSILNGYLNIESNEGLGTKINTILPNNSNKKEGII